MNTLFKTPAAAPAQTTEKTPASPAQERTVQPRTYSPYTDIYENDREIRLEMEMPGVARENVEIELKQGVLSVTGRIGLDDYKSFLPVYTEYNVGNFSRSFSLDEDVSAEKIEARMQDGVLTLTLPKAPQAQPRRIEVR